MASLELSQDCFFFLSATLDISSEENVFFSSEWISIKLVGTISVLNISRWGVMGMKETGLFGGQVSWSVRSLVQI